jgi:hypothetical protein
MFSRVQTAVRSENKRGVELPKVLHLEAILENFPQMSWIDGGPAAVNGVNHRFLGGGGGSGSVPCVACDAVWAPLRAFKELVTGATSTAGRVTVAAASGSVGAA